MLEELGFRAPKHKGARVPPGQPLAPPRLPKLSWLPHALVRLWAEHALLGLCVACTATLCQPLDVFGHGLQRAGPYYPLCWPCSNGAGRAGPALGCSTAHIFLIAFAAHCMAGSVSVQDSSCGSVALGCRLGIYGDGG